jgi:pimeloyl-ACP methyl ester carboxylesterase
MEGMLDWVFMLLMAVAAAYAALLTFAWLAADAMIFPAPPSSYTDAPDQPKLPAPDGNSITAVFLPNPAASHILLFGHGNRMDLGTADERLQLYRAHGWEVFAYEYPGYGTSSGTPTEASCCAALAAAYAYLTKLKNIPPEKIVLYGLSLGSGPAVDLASREPVGGLILEGAFLSAFRVVTRWKLLPWDRFDNIAKIGRVRAPLLSIHARQDRTVPFFHGKKLNAAHPGPKQHLWVADAHHNNILETNPVAYWDAMERFRLSLAPAPTSLPATPTT